MPEVGVQGKGLLPVLARPAGVAVPKNDGSIVNSRNSGRSTHEESHRNSGCGRYRISRDRGSCRYRAGPILNIGDGIAGCRSRARLTLARSASQAASQVFNICLKNAPSLCLESNGTGNQVTITGNQADRANFHYVNPGSELQFQDGNGNCLRAGPTGRNGAISDPAPLTVQTRRAAAVTSVRPAGSARGARICAEIRARPA
jgi:hypothetical protein